MFGRGAVVGGVAAVAVVALLWVAAGLYIEANDHSDATPPPTSIPTLPGTPGHYDDGALSFDYPMEWRTIATSGSGMNSTTYVIAVLGTGTWDDGCRSATYPDGNGGGSCTGEVVSLSPGGVVVDVYGWYGAPMPACDGDVKANATLGDLAVRETTDGTSTSWEIRMPGNEFGKTNNIVVKAWTSDPAQLAKARSIVASFRWAPGTGTTSFCYPTESPSS